MIIIFHVLSFSRAHEARAYSTAGEQKQICVGEIIRFGRDVAVAPAYSLVCAVTVWPRYCVVCGHPASQLESNPARLESDTVAISLIIIVTGFLLTFRILFSRTLLFFDVDRFLCLDII